MSSPAGGGDGLPEDVAAAEVRRGWVAGVGGLRLRTHAWLPPTGPSEPRARVLLVHGLGEHAGRYAEFARFLAARGVATVAWDQRGHGASEGRRGVVGSFEDFLEDLHRVRAFAEAEVPTERAILFGHSLGGLVALRYLQTRRPTLAGAVLSAPWLGTAADVPAWKRLASAVLRRVAPGVTLATGLDASLLTRDPVKQREYEQDPLVHDRISAGLHDAVLGAQERALAERPDPALPLLFLVPLQDELADARATLRYAEGLEGSVVEVEALEGGRHEPLNDADRTAVREHVAAWIDGLPDVEPESARRVSS